MPPARPDPNRMTFLEHLDELRRRLVFMAVAVALGFGVGWLVVRALSDLAGHDSRFDFTAFVTQVAASSAAILRRLLPVL